MMRSTIATGFMALLLVSVPNAARADATYTFTVNLTLKNLAKTLGGQPVGYRVLCTAFNVGQTIAQEIAVDVTGKLDAGGNYSGPVTVAVSTPSPTTKYTCFLQATQNNQVLQSSVASAQLWDPSKSTTTVTGTMP
jgi:hypothetical protein